MATSRSVHITLLLCTFKLLACGDSAGADSAESDRNDATSETPPREGDRTERSDNQGNPDLPPAESSFDADAGREVCETLEAVARPNAPRVLIVVDRSGSMAGERWDQVTQGVAAIAQKFDRYALGLSMYPAIGEELACMAGKLDVGTGEGNAQKIKNALFSEAAKAQADHGYTPTALTLKAAQDSLRVMVDDERARYVLLVTDGKPNCKAGGEKYDNDEPATYAALDSLRKDDVRTFVIGYRTDEFKTVMDTMAEHGGTQHHYAVEDRTELESALLQVGKSLAPCSYELDNAPEGPEYVRVLIDGKDVPYGASGFTFPREKTIELGGSACSGLRDGAEHNVKVLVECAPVRVL